MYALIHVSLGNMSHVKEEKKYLSPDVNSIARLGVQLEYSLIGGIMILLNCELSIVVDVKSEQHLDRILMVLKDSF